MQKIFQNRSEAGRHLATTLGNYANQPDTLVLALPRGGVPVGFEIAQALALPLDVLVVRKLGLPGNAEFAIGALCLLGDVQVLNPALIQDFGIPAEDIGRLIAREQAELLRREQKYRQNLPPLDLIGQRVIVVDDGLATGATMHAAVVALRQAKVARIVVAAPTAAAEALRIFNRLADEVAVLSVPEPYRSVGVWYRDFPQLSDLEVLDYLARAKVKPRHSTHF